LRLYVDHRGLWFNFLATKYGVEEGLIRRGEEWCHCGGRIYVRLARAWKVTKIVGLRKGLFTLSVIDIIRLSGVIMGWMLGA